MTPVQGPQDIRPWPAQYREATLRLGSDMMSHGPEGGLESSPAPVTHRMLSIPGNSVACPATAPRSL